MDTFKIINDKTGNSNVLCISSDDWDFIDALRIIEDYNLQFKFRGEEHSVSSKGIEPPKTTWGSSEENQRLEFTDIEEIRTQAIKTAEEFRKDQEGGQLT